ncbi:MAG: PorV/PorQ family protein [Candidatus Firestonebacteria bacterium]
MIKKTFLVFSSVLALFCADIFSANSAFTFLRIPPGARAVAMGETFAAVADGVDSIYWNPAGLANMETMDVSLTHMFYWDSSIYEYLAVSYPLNNKLKLGAHVIYLNYGAIDKISETSSGSIGTTEGTFTPYDISFAISAGYQLSQDIQIGITGKYAMQSIDTDSASAFAGDAGVLIKLKTLDENLLFGGAVSNLGTQINGDNLPLTARGGLSYKMGLMEPDDLTLAATAYYPFDTGKIAENIGAEFWYDKQIAVRAGYKLGYDVGNFTAGLGYKSILEGMFGYELDYTYAPSGNLGDTHRISIILFLDETTDSKRGGNSGGNKKKTIKIAPTPQKRRF